VRHSLHYHLQAQSNVQWKLLVTEGDRHSV
jgi:hypothetical protein